MGAVSSITSKGQITLPLEVRKRLGVGAGDKVEFVFDGQRTVVCPVRGEGGLEKWLGVVPELGSGAEIDAELRAMRGYEENAR